MGRAKTIERSAILDAAEAITMERGAAGLTIAAVAERMGITNGGVQYTFRSKEALIAAMFERWNADYVDRIDEICEDEREPDNHAVARAHIASTSNFDERSKRRAPSMLVSLLNSPQHMELTREWYRERISLIDAGTDAGRRLRTAFFAMEGAFLMRLFGLVQMEQEEWDSIVRDVDELLDHKPARNSAFFVVSKDEDA